MIDASEGSNFSPTLFALDQGDPLEGAVSHDSNSTADTYGSGRETYLTIFKVG